MTPIEAEFTVDPETYQEIEQPAAFSAARIIRRLISGLPVVLLAGVVGAAAGVAILRAMPRTYTSSVSILLDPKRPGSYGADTEFANAFVDAAKIANVELILVSSAILLRVVRTEHLADPQALGEAAPSLLDRIMSIATPHRPAPPDSVEMREARAISNLRRVIRTARAGATYVVTVEVAAPSASGAQRTAGNVANAYLAEQMDAKYASAQRDTDFLTRRINEQRQALTRSSAAVEALRKTLGVASLDSLSDSAVDRGSVTDINRELTAAEGDLAGAEARYRQADRAAHDGGVEGLSEVITSPAIAGLRSKQAAATERLADLSVRYASDYPERRQAMRDLQAINHDVASEVSRIVSGLRNDYETALTHRDVLKAQLDGLVRTVNASASAEGRTELRDAERVAEADKVAYEASLSRLRDVEQLQARQDVEARIISGPELPERPSAPKPLLIIGGASFLAMAMAGAAVLALALRRVRVDDAGEAERELASPMLAAVPYLTSLQLGKARDRRSIPDYLAANPFTVFSESFRILRLRLSSTAGRPNQVIQITSAVQGEGKSTVATSLAISAASSGIRTVLVDLDLCNPEATRLLKFEGADGVVELLNGSVGTEEALLNYRELPLSAIAAGSIRDRHPSLIESANLQTMIRDLRKQFDLVVLDTPPILGISDPLFVAKLVDATVLVIACGSTPQGLVTEAIRALRDTRAPLVGLLLNKVHFKRSASYRYGAYRGQNYLTAA